MSVGESNLILSSDSSEIFMNQFESKREKLLAIDENYTCQLDTPRELVSSLLPNNQNIKSHLRSRYDKKIVATNLLKDINDSNNSFAVIQVTITT